MAHLIRALGPGQALGLSQPLDSPDAGQLRRSGTSKHTLLGSAMVK
jgi:hypothetical protein